MTRAALPQLPEITTKTDTREILAHAAREAKSDLKDYFIVDVDAHVTETAFWHEITDLVDDEVIRFMAKSFQDRVGSPPGLLNIEPGMTYQDVHGRIPHQQAIMEPTDPKGPHRILQLIDRSMKGMGIDIQVVFPTPMLLLGMHPQPHVEVAIGRAFNRWMTERILPADPRVKGLLYLPFNDPVAACKVVEDFGDRPGVIGFTITSTRNRPVHDNSYMKLYRMIEETGKPLAFHSGFYWGDPSFLQLNRFISMHAITFVHYNLIHLTNWVINGLPERFPKLNVLWIESGLAWIPFIMQRLDSEYHMRPSEAPLLKMPPSEYIRKMYFSSQPMENQHPKLVEAGFEAFNAETQLMYASDWPHWDFDIPSSISSLSFLSEKAKRNILGLNAARVFNLPVPSGKRG